MTIRSITISLCDNDYGNTFRPLLETIHRVLQYEDQSEERVALLIFEAIRFHYLAFQSLTGTLDQYSVDYLKERVKVLFNEEADQETMKDHDGGSWHLDVASGQVSAF